jgi:phage terminase large subunit-like protein
LEQTRGERYRIKLLPRGHYKTTIDTIAESVQIALPNEDGRGQIIVPEHPWSLGPNVKILIEHETREGASRALYEISEAFLRKPLMLALFPELVPSPRKQRINKWELELPRRRGWKEPTFDAIGIGGAEQGRHYHKVKMDDIIGKEARDSVTVMSGVIDTFDNINSLMTRPRFDGFDLTGTRWSLADVYAHALEKYGLKFAQSFIPAVMGNKEPIPEGIAVAYIRAAVENDEPIFSEEFTLEDLAIIRKNKKVWNAQYANNPLDDDLLEFSPKWLKFYNVAINGDLIIFEGKMGRRRISPRNLDRVVLIDPSMGENPDSDETGIVVTGTDNKNNIFILETIRKRLRPPELIKELFRLYTKYWPRTIAIEKVNFSGIYAYWFKAECDRLKVYPSITDYSPGSKRSKEARVRGLANYGAAGQIYCMEGHTEFRDEWEKFGAITKYHLLDAFAQGPEVWRQGPKPEDVRHIARAYEIIEQHRSELTGY